MEYNTPKRVKLKKLIDGDTFDCITIPEGIVYRIRMKAIDAPELDQPAGWEAKYGLHKMLSETDFEFYITPKSVGHNNRIIADVYPEIESAKYDRVAKSLNARMCEEGLAWYFANKGNKSSNLIRSSQEKARSYEKGLWKRKLSTPMHPATWRTGNNKMNFIVKTRENYFKKAFLKEHNITLKDLNNSFPNLSLAIEKENKTKKRELEDERLMNGELKTESTINALEALAEQRSSPESRRRKAEYEAQKEAEKKDSVESESFNSYAHGASDDADDRTKKLESLIKELENGDYNDKIKAASEKLNDNLTKAHSAHWSKKEKEELEKEEYRKDLDSPTIKEKMKKDIEESNNRLKSIKSEEEEASDKRVDSKVQKSSENLSKITKEASKKIDDLFSIEDLDLSDLDFDDVDPNQTLISNEIEDNIPKENEYDPSDMDYSSNDHGFQNKVATELENGEHLSNEESNDDMPNFDNNDDMPNFDNNLPPLDSYDENECTNDQSDYDDFNNDNVGYDEIDIPNLGDLGFSQEQIVPKQEVSREEDKKEPSKQKVSKGSRTSNRRS